MAVGQNIPQNVTNSTPGANMTFFTKQIYQYSYSFVEYYYYKKEVVKKVEPKSGLTRGNTRLEVSGAWFYYRPEYGIIPHVKIGDKIARCMYYSSVRVVCPTPPNDNINSMYKVEISQNGVEFWDTGFTFHYYEQPILYKMTPTCGPDTGGT